MVYTLLGELTNDFVLWRYDDVTFAVVGSKSFVWSSKPINSWWGKGLSTIERLDLTYFLIESIGRLDSELACLESITYLPTQPLKEGSVLKIVSVDPTEIQL